MMKRLLYYLCVLFVIASCLFDENKVVDKALDDSSPEGKVLVTFSVPGVQIASSTKGLDDGDGDIESEAYLDPERLYVVVCGNSQNIKYIRKAELLGQKDARVDTIPDFPPYLLQEYQGSGQTNTTVKVYTFSVLLEIEDQIRTIHFLGNIDAGQLASGEYAYRLLPSLVSQEGKQAYWQKVKSSIRPKTDPNSGEYMIDAQTHAYIPSDETLENLQFIPLIRNYAKIQVTNNTDNFLLYSYAVCNVPSLGSVTPFRSNLPFDADNPDAGFTYRPETVDFPVNYRLSGYERCLAGSLDSIAYPGNLPAKARIEERLPSEYDFLHPGESGGRVIAYTPNSNQGFCVYERGIPNAGQDKPTVVILCGRFKAMKDGNIDPDDNTIDPEHDELFYYRLDLMETKKVDNQSVSQYYPLYRNFRYNIVVRMITSNGLETPLAALNASKVEDISADVSMRHLADISNGTTRLVVEPFMSRTYTGPHPQNPDPSSPRQYYELYARFFNHLDDVVPNKADWAVTVELEPTEDGEDILALYNADGSREYSGQMWPAADEDGLRVIRFDVIKVPEAGSAVKKQIIKITGRNYGDENFSEDLRLYREVEIYVQPPQQMVVECLVEHLSLSLGSRQTVRVYIPDGLTEAMFPLNFTLEAEDLTLTPDNTVANNSMPVTSGISISENSPYAGRQTFQFIKTLTLNDYNGLPVDQNKGMRYFDCFFKSTVSNSATTVWVANDYFKSASASFDNPYEPSDQFYIQAIDDCFVKVKQSGLQYKRGVNSTWEPYTRDAVISLQAGDIVYFKSSGIITNWTQGGDYGLFRCYSNASDANDVTKCDGRFSIGGNIASLIDGDGYGGDGSNLDVQFKFRNLFKGHVNLINASDLKLPMLKCQSECYKSMFENCTNLMHAPELPAKTMANQCYRRMFAGCTNLEEAPALPATAINGNCYQMMFYGCSKISEIRMNSNSYAQTNFISNNDYDKETTRFWLEGVASEGTIWLHPAIKNSDNWINVVPKGWKIKTYAEYPDGEEWPESPRPTD